MCFVLAFVPVPDVVWLCGEIIPYICGNPVAHKRRIGSACFDYPIVVIAEAEKTSVHTVFVFVASLYCEILFVVCQGCVSSVFKAGIDSVVCTDSSFVRTIIRIDNPHLPQNVFVGIHIFHFNGNFNDRKESEINRCCQSIAFFILGIENPYWICIFIIVVYVRNDDVSIFTCCIINDFKTVIFGRAVFKYYFPLANERASGGVIYSLWKRAVVCVLLQGFTVAFFQCQFDTVYFYAFHIIGKRKIFNRLCKSRDCQSR